MKRCPLISKDCIESKCAWWADFWMRENVGDVPHLEQACIVTRIPSMMVELMKNTGGIQAAVENRGNETIKRQDQLVNLQTQFVGMIRSAAEQRRQLS